MPVSRPELIRYELRRRAYREDLPPEPVNLAHSPAELLQHRSGPARLVMLRRAIHPPHEGPDMGPVLTQEFAIKDCSDRGNDAAPDLHEPRLVDRRRRDPASIRSRPPRQAP